MKEKIAVIGGGIVGATAAYHLTKQDTVDVTVFDEGIGQATAAAAGIICPWLSQRRNQNWYRLVSYGASLYPELMEELTALQVSPLPYEQVGAYVFKKTTPLLEKLEKIAYQKRVDAPMMGELCRVSAADVSKTISGWAGKDGAIFCSGGGRVDGHQFVNQLLDIAQQRGAHLHQERVQLEKNSDGKIVVVRSIGKETFDKVLLASGAWLKELLQPLQYEVDVRPQKGQLLELQLETAEDTSQWPVCMLHGEIDILPFENGKVIVGATHENEQGFDLTPNETLLENMYEEACEVFPPLRQAKRTGVRVGTRAYTSDFLPFFGQLTEEPQLFVASGLGSSGLTSGVAVGKLLAQLMLQEETKLDTSVYSPEAYLQKQN